MDGKERETKSGRTVFTFTVPLSGEHKMEAVSGELRDESLVRRVDAPNPAYRFRKQAVINWFDSADYDPNCYSVKDTMGALSRDPRITAPLVRHERGPRQLFRTAAALHAKASYFRLNCVYLLAS